MSKKRKFSSGMAPIMPFGVNPVQQSNDRNLIRAVAEHFSAGRFELAEREATNLLKKIPNSDILYCIQGAARLSMGQIAAAKPSLKKAIRINPKSADAQNTLGNLYLLQNDAKRAIERFRAALKLRPDLAEAQANIGHGLLLLQKKPDQALAQFDGALKKKPDFGNAQFGRGLCLQTLGRYTEAAEAFEAAIARRFSTPEVHAALGVVLVNLGRPDDALQALDKAFRMGPKSAETYCSIGKALVMLSELGPAGECFKRAKQLERNYGEAYYGEGIILVKQSKFSAAIERLEKARSMGLRTENLFSSLGAAYLGDGRTDAALEAHRKAIAINPQSPVTQELLAGTFQKLGRFAEANDAYVKALELSGGQAQIFQNYTRSRQFTGDEPILETMRLRFEDSDTPDGDKILIGFSLAKAMEDAGRHGEVFRYLDAAHGLQRQTSKIRLPDMLQELAYLKQAFSGEVLARYAGSGTPDPTPIFIVGMPRSGTTLLEQILSCHSRVNTAGERVELLDLTMDRLFSGRGVVPDFGDVPTDVFKGIGDDYVAALRATWPHGDFITDKMPHNFRWAGVIRLALPNARILHMRRDPRDVCLSMYKSYFQPGRHEYSHDLRDLGTYYNAYRELMSYWDSVIPGTIHTVEYANLVETPETEIRRVLDFCGLEFEAACLEPHESKHAIHTLSSYQARQPIYKSSVAAWKKYQTELAPLLEVLKLD